MDLEKLKLIKQDILKEPLEFKKYSTEFCGLYVDGTGKLTFDLADALFHSFKVFSVYNYPIYLFIASNNSKEEIEKILEKYPDTKVYNIPPLKTPLEYNEWMMNYPWFLIDPKFERVFTFQEDGGLIKRGWEEYVVKGDWDYIGAPWNADTEVLADNCILNTLRVGNGGTSYRKIKSIIKVVQHINKCGGQHKFFKGIKIDGVVKQRNSWLAEDAMLCSVGASFDLLKLPNEEEARKFSHEPIELSLYIDKNNTNRPLAFHKIDN